MLESQQSSPKDIRVKAVGAAGWSSLSKITQYVMSLVFFAVLGNMLPPSDFGLLSTVLIVTQVFAIVGNFGLGAALIQRKEATDEHYSSVLCFNLATAVIYYGLVALAGGFIADYFGNPLISQLLLVSALMFFPEAINVVYYTKLEKELNFKPIFIANTLGRLAAGVFAIILALQGFGVWSLIVRSVIYATVVLIVQAFLLKWFPGIRFNKERIGELWSFGINLTGFRFAKYWTTKLDGLLVLKFIGESALGFYSKAIGMVVDPVKMLSGAMGEIMFPTMSALNQRKEEMRKVFLDGFSSLMIVVFPFCVAGYFIAEPITRFVLGEEWLPIIPVFQAMFFVALTQSLIISSDWIFLATGETNSMFKWSIASALGILSAISISLYMGLNLERVAWIYALVSFAILPILLFVSGRLISVSFKDYWSRSWEIILLAIIMAVGLTVSKYFLAEQSNEIHLIGQIICAAGLFSVCVLVLKPRSYEIFRSHILPRLLSTIGR